MNIPLVILHGWGANVKSYDKLKPLLEQKGISVFVFDLPGFGNEPAPASAWAVDDYVEWVEGKIKQVVKIPPAPPLQKGEGAGVDLQKEKEKFILFGHSFGGRIAIRFAAKYPEKLAGLILCDAAGITPRPKVRISVFGIISKIGKIIFSLPILKYLMPIAKKIIYFLAGAKDYHRLQNSVMKEVFGKVIKEDLAPYLEKIKAPTLIAWGRNDEETPVSDAYIMHDKIKRSRLEILEGVGHSPHIECPEKLIDIVDSFLKKVLQG